MDPLISHNFFQRFHHQNRTWATGLSSYGANSAIGSSTTHVSVSECDEALVDKSQGVQSS